MKRALEQQIAEDDERHNETRQIKSVQEIMLRGMPLAARYDLKIVPKMVKAQNAFSI